MANFPFRTLIFLMQKRSLTTPATLFTSTISPSSSSFTVKYLMNSCGLPLESALSTSQKLQLDEKNHKRLDSVLNFLKCHGFDDTHIAKLIQKQPLILRSKIDNNLKPKFEYLIENGFVGSFLAEIIVANPFILNRSLSSHLKPSLDFLKTFLGTNEKVVAAIKRSSWLLTSDLKRITQKNIDVLIKEGVPVCSISKLMVSQPRVLMQSVDRMIYSIRTIKKLGIEPCARSFVVALHVMLSMSESTWNRKVEVFKSLGWSEDDVISTFKRDPLCLACSEEKLRRIMDFYVNTMKLDLENIIACPKLIKYAIDKRIRPRYHVLQALEAKNLLKEKKIVLVLTQNEKTFKERYVLKHLDKIPGLIEIYGDGVQQRRSISDNKEAHISNKFE